MNQQMRQDTLWTGDNHGTVNINHSPLTTNGKLIYDQNIKINEDLKQWLHDISAASGDPVAKVARTAICFFKLYYPIHRQMSRSRFVKAIFSLIENLS